MNLITPSYHTIVEEITHFPWADLKASEITAVAWAYYYFSVQFRENLEATQSLYPEDPQLQILVIEECNTANLSPWSGVAAPSERMDHDEFMRRSLMLSPLDADQQALIKQAGANYLDAVRAVDTSVKAMSIASYECGGLEAVFRAILQAKEWNTPLLAAFQHFLGKHIEFDSEPTEGHGALIRHIVPDDRVRPLWLEFRDLLLRVVPRLSVG